MEPSEGIRQRNQAMEQVALIESLKPALLSSPDLSTEALEYRKEAYKLLTKHGLPSSKQEDWKYSNTSALLRCSMRTPTSNEPSTSLPPEQEAQLGLPGGESARLVFVDGVFSKKLSKLDPVAEGAPLTVLPLSSVVAAKLTGSQLTSLRTDVIEKLSAELVTGDLGAKDCHKPDSDRTLDGFNFLNSALLGEGCVVSVKRGATVAKPVHIVCVATKESADLIAPFRNIYLVGENAEAQVVESYLGADSLSYCTSAVSHVYCEQAARFTHTKIQREGDQSYHLARLNMTLKDRANCTSNVFAFGGKFVRNEINPLLDGEGIECHMLGLTTLKDEQQVDNNTVLDHAKPNCFSRELYKGIYADSSHGVFGGTIIVRPDAQKTNAIQSNQSILLSDSASIDTRPQLKIWADDVKCTHGATVGQLDKEALFYIRSRGVSEPEARALLIHAFASEIVAHLPSPELRSWVEELLSARLATMLGSACEA